MQGNLEIFDSHLHIIDPRFPLVPNQGYLPGPFTCEDYLNRLSNYKLKGGAIVSGSFQAFDQSYLLSALETLGPNFVGVTQLPANTTDDEIVSLTARGVRALRFNLKRGGSETIAHLTEMAARVYDVAEWHVELYVDSSELEEIFLQLTALPQISIDHLGLSQSGFKALLKLVEQGAKVKATGFSRVDFDVVAAIRDIHTANPHALMFGTDLPSTRAPTSYQDSDALAVLGALGSDANRAFTKNALELYRIENS